MLLASLPLLLQDDALEALDGAAFENARKRSLTHHCPAYDLTSVAQLARLHLTNRTRAWEQARANHVPKRHVARRVMRFVEKTFEGLEHRRKPSRDPGWRQT